MVRKAVEQNGLALEFASEDLKGDRKMVHIAATQNDLALEFASKKLLQYWELVKDMDKDDWDVAKDAEHLLMNREEQNRYTLTTVDDDYSTTNLVHKPLAPPTTNLVHESRRHETNQQAFGHDEC